MGAFDIVSNIVIPDDSNPDEAAAFRKRWKWEAHEQVIIKGAYTAADQEKVENAAATVKRGEKNRREMDLQSGTARRMLLETMIVDWTFARDGRKVSVSRETIGLLPAHYRTPILEKIDELTEGMSEEE